MVERRVPAAYERALKLLERRPHFARELALKLGRAGCPEPEIVAALERLAGLRLLDDEALARSYAAELARRKGYGRARIVQELARRGAPEEAIGMAVGELTPDDELARAREVAAKWARSSPLEPAALARHLARRGYPRHVIFRVLREFAPGAEASPEDS